MMTLTWDFAIKDLFSPAATVAGALFATWGISRTIRNNRVNQDSKIAHDAYDGYLKDAISYPAFASGVIDVPTVKKGVDIKEFYVPGTLSNDFLKYEWIVARMLSASERILAVTSGDRDWEETIKSQIALHRLYLSSKFFGPEELKMYSNDLRRLIAEVVKIDADVERTS